jgi:hypothetical protein
MRTSTIFRDPIVEEVRDIKRRLAGKFDYDVRAMLKDAQRRQTRGGHKVLVVPPRKASKSPRPK